MLVLLLLFEWSGVMGWLPSGQAAQPVSLALPSAAELAKAGSFTPQSPSRWQANPNELVAGTEALVRSLPGVRFDLAARAQALSPGVEPTFQFVRNQVRFEAYPGVLRGAEGTYATRAGNAFDRSLLLADLLKRKSVKTRFAMGKLPRLQAERLFARIFDSAPPLETDAVGKPSATGGPEAEAFMTRLRTRAVRDYAAIRKALGNALPTTKASPSRDEVVLEIEGHVWVQAEVNGRWVDLDSAFGDAVPGRTYTSVERALETLPKEVYQRVTIRVSSEMLAGGSLKTETALEFSATVEELRDRQIFLTHTPGGGGGGLAGAISGAVGGPDAWTPMLWVDGQFHVGKPISFADQKPPERGRPPSGGLGGLFGPGSALSASSQFVAEWVEFEIAFPDGRREVVRRALIDRAGTAWRQGGKLDPVALRPLVRDAEGLMVPRTLHNIWFSAGRHNLAGYVDALRLLASWVRDVANQIPNAPQNAGTPQGSAPSLSFGELVWPFAMANFALLVQSDHVVVPSMNEQSSHRFYADSPRIILISLGFEKNGGEAQPYVQYDLRRDQLRGLARETSGMVGVVERKIWFGTLQGALEHEVAAQHAGTAAPGAVISTSSLLTSEGLVVFRPGASQGSQRAVNPETAARIAHAQANGAVLVVPRQVLQGGVPGWWEIAGNTSDTRAVLGDNTNGVRSNLPGLERVPGGDYWRPTSGWRPPKPGRPGSGWEPTGRPPWRGPEQIGPKIQIPTDKPGGMTVDNPYYPKTDECVKKKGGSLPTPGIRVAMASSRALDLLDGKPRESVRPPLLLAQTSTEYTLVTECVAKPAVGVAALAIPILAFAALAVGAAVLGYLIGSAL